MTRVRAGYPEHYQASLFGVLPVEVQLVPVPAELRQEMELDFWVPPFPQARAQAQWPFLRGVKVVQSPYAGVDWLHFVPRDVTLCDGRGIHDVSTSEYVVSVILACLKFLPEYRDAQREGHWLRPAEAMAATKTQGSGDVPATACEEISDKTVMIVGYGAIGEAIEKRLAGFGPKLIRVARSAREGVEPVSQLPELLPLADVVVLILPLTAETKGLMNADLLRRMKPGALLLNAARGPVVDTDALVAALQSRRIRAAADVTDPEPLPEGHPLWSAPNFFLTPHIAGNTPEFLPRALKFAGEQMVRFARGEPLLNLVDPSVGY